MASCYVNSGGQDGYSGSAYAEEEESMDVDMDFQDDYQAAPAQPAPPAAPPAAAAAPPTSAKRTSSGDVKPNSNPPTTTVYYGSPAPAGLPVPSTSGTSGSSAPPAPAPTSKNARRRQKLKARRKLSEVYICVLDTNVLLDDLNGIKTMVNNCNNKSKAGGGGGSLVHKVIIPMVVLQELDGIKSDKSRAKHQTAQSAAKFLNAQLIIPNGFVKGEPDKNPATRMSEHTFQVLGNDDRIVECCLRLRELHSDKTVILLSHDINLRNKALTLNIEATVMDDFIGRLKASAMKAPPPPPERPTSNETSQPMELEIAFEPAPPAPTAGEPTQKRLKENPKVPPPPPPPTPPAKPAPKVVPKKPAPVAQSNSKPYQKGPNQMTPNSRPYLQGPNQMTPNSRPYSQGPNQMTPNSRPYSQGPNQMTPNSKPYQKGPLSMAQSNSKPYPKGPPPTPSTPKVVPKVPVPTPPAPKVAPKVPPAAPTPPTPQKAVPPKVPSTSPATPSTPPPPPPPKAAPPPPPPSVPKPPAASNHYSPSSSNTTTGSSSGSTDLEAALSRLIVSQLERQFGPTWTTIFNRYNPRVATLKDSLKMLKDNWMGVFSDCFRRDNSVIGAVKGLLDTRTGKSLQGQLYSRLLGKVRSVVHM